MIRKSGDRFSEKIMLNENGAPQDDGWNDGARRKSFHVIARSASDEAIQGCIERWIASLSLAMTGGWMRGFGVEHFFRSEKEFHVIARSDSDEAIQGDLH